MRSISDRSTLKGRKVMPKPRFGFYITEKFPKAPRHTDEGWEASLPDGAVVFYDMEAFLNASDEELLKYCGELIGYFSLAFEPKELLDLVALAGINQSLPKDKNLARKVIEQTPGLEIVEEKNDA